MHGKLAKDHPEWKWTMMWKSWEYLCDWLRLAGYTDPDNFGMYVYNDFHGYGVLSLGERQVRLSWQLTGDLLAKSLFPARGIQQGVQQKGALGSCYVVNRCHDGPLVAAWKHQWRLVIC
jgi:hypothetical protein